MGIWKMHNLFKNFLMKWANPVFPQSPICKYCVIPINRIACSLLHYFDLPCRSHLSSLWGIVEPCESSFQKWPTVFHIHKKRDVNSLDPVFEDNVSCRSFEMEMNVPVSSAWLRPLHRPPTREIHPKTIEQMMRLRGLYCSWSHLLGSLTQQSSLIQNTLWGKHTSTPWSPQW